MIRAAQETALVLAVLLSSCDPNSRSYVYPSTSMEPTIREGERVTVRHIPDLKAADLAREDVVLFKRPEEPNTLYLKRVLALPGETIEIRNGIVLIDDTKIAESYLGPDFVPNIRSFFGPFEVQPGFVFVLGDNRNRSADSRLWGAVPESNLIGKWIAAR